MYIVETISIKYLHILIKHLFISIKYLYFSKQVYIEHTIWYIGSLRKGQSRLPMTTLKIGLIDKGTSGCLSPITPCPSEVARKRAPGWGDQCIEWKIQNFRAGSKPGQWPVVTDLVKRDKNYKNVFPNTEIQNTENFRHGGAGSEPCDRPCEAVHRGFQHSCWGF